MDVQESIIIEVLFIFTKLEIGQDFLAILCNTNPGSGDHLMSKKQCAPEAASFARFRAGHYPANIQTQTETDQFFFADFHWLNWGFSGMWKIAIYPY